ncbi:MAG: putative nucleic acid-binding Zn-ribbon protein [Candidatus Krumholzibacteriia bacterium]|jgi:predicted  nucleic acid-binding Zn-ribbon protein
MLARVKLARTLSIGKSLDEKILLNLLVEFADVEEQMARAEFAMERRTSRTRDLRDLQAEYEEEAAEAVKGDYSASARLKSKELAIKAAEASVTLKKDQVVGVSDGRQLKALQTEIIGLELRLVQMEDEALALLSSLEDAESRRRENAEDSETSAVRGKREVAKLDQQSERADSVLPHLESELERLLSMMPEATKRHVMRLRKNGDQSVARIESGACGGCFSQLPPQQGVDAERGRGVIKCASCARFVVHKQWR